MSNLICVTNRHLCQDDFIRRVEAIAKAKPFAIMLREKDLSENAYKLLASQVMPICEKYGVLCILHSFFKTAYELNATAIHLPLPLLRTMTALEKSYFTHLGASCHSLAEAQEAASLGATYITLGHIFSTSCKKGLPPRGLSCLDTVCKEMPLPVYAIGGINATNFSEVLHAGAQGACVMSSVMTTEDLEHFIDSF